MNDLSDTQLVSKLSGDSRNEAFSVLYEKYFDVVYRFVYGRLGEKSATEEVVSETFMTLYEIGEKYNGKSKFQTFALGIALNKTRQFIDRKKRFNFINKDESEFIDIEEDPSGNITNSRSKNDIEKILISLPKKYAEILSLKYLKGMANNDIAKKMNITKGNVRVLQHRALAKAAKLFRKNG